VKASAVTEVMQELGSYNPHPKVNSMGDYGALSCPLAPWTHGGGRDANPSMMVSIGEGMSWTTCLTCSFNGSVKSLVWEVHKYGGIDRERADDLSYFITLQETQHYEQLRRQGITATPIHQDLLDSLNKEHPYWSETRGLDRSTIREWGLGFYWPEMRATIPFWDMGGSLVAVVGRDVTGESKSKYKVMPSGFNRGEYLFGEHRVTGKEDSLLVVEGYMDAIKASMYLPTGMGVVALGAAIITKEQARRLAVLTDHVYLALDSDKSGELGAARVRKALGSKVRLTALDLGWYKDIDEVGAELPTVLAEGKEAVYAPVKDSLKRLATRPTPKRLKVDKPHADAVKWSLSNERS